MFEVTVKYLLSFLKSDWSVDDYPVRYRHFDVDESVDFGRLKPVRWGADIINWIGMSGSGDTPEDALADLHRNFAARKAQGLPFPRPGRGFPLEFAPTYLIGEHPELARDFFRQVLDLNLDECFISNESSLWDFHVELSNDHLNERVLLTYGVDISDIESGNLAEIFIRLVSRGVSV